MRKIKPSKDYEQFVRRIRGIVTHRPSNNPKGRPRSNHQCLGCGKLYYFEKDAIIPSCIKCGGKLIWINNP